MSSSSSTTFGLSSLMFLVFLSMFMLSDGERRTPTGTSRVHMNITNNLGKIPLFIRCQSADDDIGRHVLHFHESLKWNFKPAFFFRHTLFFCSMKWRKVAARIDVYDQEKDLYRCDQRCWWSIKQDGAYFFNENTETFELMHKW